MHRRLLLGLLAGAAFVAPVRFALAAPLSAADTALINQVQNYLNGLTSLTANFLQVASDGSTRTGKAWLQRPGKMRFEYDPPDKQLLVAGFGLLVYHDPDLSQTTNIPLGSTPLGILLANHVVLSGDVTVTSVDHQPGEIHVTLIRTGKPQEGSLTLVFGTNPLELRQWVVMDAQQRQTRVSLYDIAPGGPFPDSLFTYQGQTPTTGGG
ncbi:MAG TPA: outer membrane lipoprotein carrier protein LolA [Acidocella sp.]|nr:MAG: cell envelope biogenesis protein LolA [Acidocella sp. 20-58-15]OYY02479.1 MAG: cell envelope biogenesis protein LolA [Acidocella sp. 35-58-6]HQT38063.1 outer membrane lipoprotein carrier protein LolA [Acidocella sp.]